ncbi:MAG: hypothetical protein JSR46_04845, partial [Verrucomicrobia bacterium]|nr:hypothetical protein [Verrucomicrobiota bacterium]
MSLQLAHPPSIVSKQEFHLDLTSAIKNIHNLALEEECYRRRSAGEEKEQDESTLGTPSTDSSFEESKDGEKARSKGFFSFLNRSAEGQKTVEISVLSVSCLKYCQLYWLQSFNKKFKGVVQNLENDINDNDRVFLKNNKFLEKPKLGMILQEQVIRKLNSQEKIDKVFI